MRYPKILCLCGCLIGLLTMALAPKNGIVLEDSSLRLDLPDNIYFTLEVSSSATIEKITLLYQSNAHSCQQGIARQDVEFDAGTQVEAEWIWELKYSGTIPPGAELSWQWEIEDSDGNKLLTDLQTATVEDDAYTWQKISQDEVSVWWVEGGQAFGNQMLDLALESLDRLQQDVGVRPSRPVILVLYPDVQSMQDAMLFEAEWTGGVAFWDYGVVVIGLGPGETEWAEDVIPHELAHVVTRELMVNCYGVQPPTWLVEGLAVYLEGPAKEEDIKALRAALDAGTLTPLHSLASGFSNNPNKVNLDYAQGGEVVRFLIETHGPEKMAALLAALQSGSVIETALQEVYGLNTDGIDAAWQQSWGYDVTIPTPEPTSASSKPVRSAVPTLALWTAAVQATATLTPTMTDTATLPTLPDTVTSSTTPLPPETQTPAAPAATETPVSGGRSGLPCGSAGLVPIGLLVFLTGNNLRNFVCAAAKPQHTQNFGTVSHEEKVL